MPNDLAAEWSSTTLGDVAEWLSGGTPSKSTSGFWGGDIPWVSPKDMKVFRLGSAQDWITDAGLAAGSRLVPENSTLLVVRGMILAHTFPVCLTTRPVAFNQDVKALIPVPEADGCFLAHWLVGNSARMLGLVTEATHGTKRIDLKDIQRYALVLPPKPEQHRIATILDTLDDTIRQTEQVIAKLQQMKQGLLHDLLTRGIDDHGEVRDPERRPESFKESMLGQIPRAWDVRKLAQVAEVRSGIAKNAGKAVSNPVSVHYLRVANVQDGYLDLSEMSQLVVSKDDVEHYAVLPGDVLMNEGGDLDKLGRGAIWRGQYSPCVHQNHVFVVRCGSELNPAFLDAWTGSIKARRYFMVAGKQTTNLASINKTALGKLPVALPSPREQAAIVNIIAGAQARLDDEAAAVAKLYVLKQGLMEDLLTGRVRTPGTMEVTA